jgi:antirestriction protein ArdC
MKNDAFQVITDRIVGLLEKGIVPWQKPWQGGEMMPRNLVSKKGYRGANVFLLHAMSFNSPFWLTFNQARELGGCVKKGERACPVVFWKWLEADAPGEPTGTKNVPFLRYYSVFNVAQCEGIPPDKIPDLKGSERAHSPIVEAERIVADMPKKPEIRHGGGRACYSPSFDRVEMPQPETFRSGQDYYSVLFHELTHSTGHQSRLSRKGVASSEGEWSAFGSTPYAREELVAEMGAAFLAGHAGIVERTIENSAAYVQSWLQRLKDDSKLVVQAAAQAQKAADFILGRQFAQAETESVA